MASFTETSKDMQVLTVEDGAEDLTKVEGIDTNGISRCLEVRFKRDEIYTYCGTVLVACNPFKRIDIYGPSVMREYTGTRMGSEAPHIYATAEAAFDKIRNKERNQSVVISGESGAGKTVNTKHILNYLTTVATPARNANDNWITKQILEANTVLEAFGNAKTLRNNNSSRFGKFTQVCFEATLSIGGCVIEDYLLEKGRITWQAIGERNYHVFYQLCAACRKNPEDRVKYMVEAPKTYRYLAGSECFTCEGVDDFKEFEDVRKAMTVLSMPDDFQSGIFSAVSVVLWLGNLDFEDVDGERIDFSSSDMKIIEKISSLLKIEVSYIRKALEFRVLEVRGNVSEIPLKFKDAVAARDTLAQTIYSRTFSMIIDHINKQTNKGDASTFIGVLDIFGFEDFKVNSFEQLCINWTNEKLHKIFNEYNFEQEQAEYREEGISVENFEFKPNDRCLELIEKGKKCILGYLDESCKLKTSTDADFLDKVHRALPEPFPDYYVKPDDKTKVTQHFGVRHFAGVVLYNIEGFVGKNRAANQDLLWKMLQSSPLSYVKEMGTPPPPRYAEAAAASAGDKRNFTPSQGAMFKEQLGELQRTLSLTDPWYVRCIKTNNKLKPAIWEGEMVLEQLQYTGMLEVIQIRSRGFPCKVKFKDFLDKYRCLAPADVWGADVEPADTVRAIMQLFEQLNPEDWQVGLTKVFLRQRCYDPLEDMRRKVIADAATVIQSYWKMLSQRLHYLHTKQLGLYLQMRYHIYISQITERRERVAKERLHAWILGFRARKMYYQMLRERDEKKKSKADRKAERDKMLDVQGQLEALQGKLDKASERHEEACEVTRALRATLEELKERGGSREEIEEAEAALATAEIEEGEALLKVDELSKEENELRRKLKKMQAVAGKKGDVNTYAARKKMRQSKGHFSAGAATGTEEVFFYVDEMGVLREGKRTGEVIDGDSTLLTFANRHFRDDFVAGKSRSAASFQEMLMYTKDMNIPQSLTLIESIDMQKLAIKCWHDMQKYLRGSADVRSANVRKTVDWLCAQGRQNQQLRDELYCQLARQLTVAFSKNTRSLLQRGWMLMKYFCTSFPPSNALYKDLTAFFHSKEKDAMRGALGGLPTQAEKDAAESILRAQTLGRDRLNTGNNNLRSMSNAATMARGMSGSDVEEIERTPDMILRGSPAWVRAAMKQTKTNGVRKYAHSTKEYDAIYENRDFEATIWFHDGTHIQLSVSGSAIASEIITDTVAHAGLENSDGWGIFSVYNDHQQAIRSMEYIGDIVSLWEEEVKRSHKHKRASMVPPKSATEAEAELQAQIDSLDGDKLLLRRHSSKASIQQHKAQRSQRGNGAPRSSMAVEDKQAERAAKRREKEEKLEEKKAIARIQKLQAETKNKNIAELQRHRSELMELESKAEAMQSIQSKMKYNKLVLGFERGRDPLEVHNEVRQPIFMFQKRLFKRDKALVAGSTERRLIYHQSQHAVLTSMIQVPVRDALYLGALRAYLDLGSFQNMNLTDIKEADEEHYGALEKYLSDRVISNYQREYKRDRKEWVVLLAKRHRDLPADMEDDKAMEEYIRVASTSDMYGSTFFPARYIGFWPYPQVVDVAVHEHGLKFTNRTTRDELRTYIWDRLEDIKVATKRELAEHAGSADESRFIERITINVKKAGGAADDPFNKEQLSFTFETPMARDIAGLIASYSPHKEHQSWGVPKELEAKALHKELTPEEKHLQYIELMQVRKDVHGAKLLNPDYLLGGALVGKRKSHTTVLKGGRVLTHPGLGKDYYLDPDDPEQLPLIELEEAVPRAYWQYTSQPAAKTVPLLNLYPDENTRQRKKTFGKTASSTSTPEMDIEHAQRLFQSLRVFCGLESAGGYLDCEDTERAEIMMVQACISRCIDSPILCDEFFMQLIKMTSEHPRPDSRESHRIWSFFAITAGIVAPHDEVLYNYLMEHLKRIISTNSSISSAARYCRDKVQISHSKRARKYPPSEVEQICAGALQPIQTRVYFLDKQFQTYQHEPYTNMPELLAQVKEKIGLSDDVQAYTLFEIFGHGMEREMQAHELVADLLFKWEKFASATNSTDVLELTLKRGPLFTDLVRPANKVEFMLSLHQAIYDVVHGKFPVTEKEAIFLAALRAQHTMGDFSRLKVGSGRYRYVVEQFCPAHMHDDPEIADDIAEHHERMRGMDQEECDKLFLDTVLKWPYYGSMLYEVEQTYTSSYPQCLWLAVNAEGIGMIARGEKEPLMSYTYHEIISFSPSLRCLMVVAGSLDNGIKYVFQTSQASQIAVLMTRYCQRLKDSGTSEPLPVNVGGNAQEEAEQMIKKFDPMTRFNFSKRTFGGRSMYKKETPEDREARKARAAERRKAATLRFEAEIKKAELELAKRKLEEEALAERQEEEDAARELARQKEAVDGKSAEGGAGAGAGEGDGEEDEYAMVARAVQQAAVGGDSPPKRGSADFEFVGEEEEEEEEVPRESGLRHSMSINSAKLADLDLGSSGSGSIRKAAEPATSPSWGGANDGEDEDEDEDEDGDGSLRVISAADRGSFDAGGMAVLAGQSNPDGGLLAVSSYLDMGAESDNDSHDGYLDVNGLDTVPRGGGAKNKASVPDEADEDLAGFGDVEVDDDAGDGRVAVKRGSAVPGAGQRRVSIAAGSKGGESDEDDEMV